MKKACVLLLLGSVIGISSCLEDRSKSRLIYVNLTDQNVTLFAFCSREVSDSTLLIPADSQVMLTDVEGTGSAPSAMETLGTRLGTFCIDSIRLEFEDGRGLGYGHNINPTRQNIISELGYEITKFDDDVQYLYQITQEHYDAAH